LIFVKKMLAELFSSKTLRTCFICIWCPFYGYWRVQKTYCNAT